MGRSASKRPEPDPERRLERAAAILADVQKSGGCITSVALGVMIGVPTVDAARIITRVLSMNLARLYPAKLSDGRTVYYGELARAIAAERDDPGLSVSLGASTVELRYGTRRMSLPRASAEEVRDRLSELLGAAR